MEIWKDIEGFEGYQISNLGSIKSLDRYVNGRSNSKPFRKGKILVGYKEPNRYCKIVINRSMRYIHRLVALAFIDNPANKRTVNHKDGNKHNNNVDNLEWMTDSENTKHSYDVGLKVAYDMTGVNNPNYKHGKRMIVR